MIIRASLIQAHLATPYDIDRLNDDEEPLAAEAIVIRTPILSHL